MTTPYQAQNAPPYQAQNSPAYPFLSSNTTTVSYQVPNNTTTAVSYQTAPTQPLLPTTTVIANVCADKPADEKKTCRWGCSKKCQSDKKGCCTEEKKCCSCCTDDGSLHSVFLFDTNEYFNKEEAPCLSKMLIVYNKIYRGCYKVFFAFILALCFLCIPFIGFAVGAYDVLITLFVRPFLRPIGKIFRDLFGLSNSTYFNYCIRSAEDKKTSTPEKMV